MFGTDVISNGLPGSLRIQSASPFAVMGLRFAGTVFSTLPIAVAAGISGVPSITLAAGPTANSPAAGTVGGATAVLIPEFAIAGGWATQVALVNNSNARSEEHTSELQSHSDLVCRLLLEKKKQKD